MTSIAEPERTTEAPEDEHKARRRAEAVDGAYARADAWGAMAAFLKANPRIAERCSIGSMDIVLCSVTLTDDPVAFIRSAAEAAVKHGLPVEAYTSGDGRWGGVALLVDMIRIHVYAEASTVMTSRVVGMVEKVERTLTFDLPVAAGFDPVASVDGER